MAEPVAAPVTVAPRALVTGSSDGIGAEVARRLERSGYAVVRHARSDARAEQLRAGLPDGAPVVVGDLASLASTRAMAAQAGALGPFEVVVHNAGWSAAGDDRPVTADGMEQTFQVNVVAPYLLGVLLPRPRRLVVVGSDSVRGAHLDLADLQGERSWDAGRAYAGSKIAVTALSFALARRWPEVVLTVVHPGWVRTKMSGDAAPLSVEEGADTVVWLAEGTEPAARLSGVLYSQRQPVTYNDEIEDPAVQEAVLEAVQRLSGQELG